MTPEYWQRIEQVFHLALAQPASERVEFIKQACQGDQEMQREIESLLVHEEPANRFMEAPGIAVVARAIAQDRASSLIGTQIGAYRVISLLAVGGMGEVFRARDSTLARDVALKVLPEAFLNDTERVARFDREARVLASLNHPNIATIHGFVDDNGVRALVMELVEGPTLADRVAGKMPWNEALAIAKQITEGLEYAHEKGFVHRDLKPANVKLTSDGNVKLLDFGLAKALEVPGRAVDPSISPTLTGAGTRPDVILGTAAYMAPEQARGVAVDKRADIWAFGAVLYQMLTGKQPFPGATVSDTIAAVLTKDPDWDPVPLPLRPLVRRCLEKDSRRRLRDIGEGRLVIEELLSGRATSAEAVRRPLRTRLVPWAIAGVLGLTLVLANAFWWRGIRPVNQPLMRLSLELPEYVAREGAGMDIVLSPDGKRIVYTGRGADGKLRLYTRTLNQDHSEPVPETENPDDPFLSPDGEFIGFFSLDDGKLKTISVRGGRPAVLCDAKGNAGASWAEDGTIIAALTIAGPLSRIPATGGSPQPVTELKNDEFYHRWPQVLPGARAVLFTTGSTHGGYDEDTIAVQSLRTGERKTLIQGGFCGVYVPSGHLLYIRPGILYAAPMNSERLEVTGPSVPILEDVATDWFAGSAHMAVARNGTLVYARGKEAPRFTLVWIDNSGHTQPLRTVAAEYSNLRFSPDGRRLAMTLAQSGNVDVWVYEWERDVMTRLTTAPGYDHIPVWTPDGKHIVFSSVRNSPLANLYWIRSDGEGEAIRLTTSKNFQAAASFSPDGKRLLFKECDLHKGCGLWILPLENTGSDHPKAGKPEPFLVTPFDEDEPEISPDGRWVAYESNESGTNEVYVRRFPGPGGKWRISTGTGGAPVWSRGRQELFYRGADGAFTVVNYTVNRETFVPGKPQLWADGKHLGDYDIAPDGRRFAAVHLPLQQQTNSTYVTIVLNFFDELRRRAPVADK